VARVGEPAAAWVGDGGGGAGGRRGRQRVFVRRAARNPRGDDADGRDCGATEISTFDTL
jgi:hypothetical protein